MAEIERLQRVFDVFDDESGLRRWLRGEAGASPELVAVIELAERWRERSGGVFDPASAVFTALWDASAGRDVPPTVDELGCALQAIRETSRPAAPGSAKA